MTDFPIDAGLASEFQKTHRHLFDLLSMIEQPAWCFHSPTGEILLSNSVAATISMLPATNWFEKIAAEDLHLVTSIADWSQLERKLKLQLKVDSELVPYTVRLRTCSASDQGKTSETAIAIASRAGTDTKDRQRSKSARFKSLVDNLPVSVIHKDIEGRVVFANRQYFQTAGVALDGSDPWSN